MKKNIFVIILCVMLLPSGKVVASAKEEEPPSILLAKTIVAVGIAYIGSLIYDALQKYIPETREMKRTRMQEKVLELTLKQLEEQEKKQEKTVVQKNITFADYIDVPQKAIELVKQLKNPEPYIKMGIPVPHGVLLTGDPGTGKTYLARAIAGEVDCPFLVYSGPDFIRPLIGSGGQAISQAFSDARQAAINVGKNVAIIFIDEFDAIGARSSGSDLFARNQTELVNTFLTQIDGFNQDNIKVIVIAATNFPQNIDPALTRSGRLDTTIHISYPNENARKQMISLKINNAFINPNIKNLADKLAMATHGASQAEISTLFIEAGRKAIEKNIDQTGIDYDCFAKTLWDMKKANYEKQLPPRPDKEKLVNSYLYTFRLGNIPKDVLLSHMANMTLLDIEEVANHAYKFAQTRPEKTLIDWLWIAIEAKNQQIQIRQNTEVANLCRKLYAPLDMNYTKEELIEKQPDDIFKDFENLYNSSKITEPSQIPDSHQNEGS